MATQNEAHTEFADSIWLDHDERAFELVSQIVLCKLVRKRRDLQQASTHIDGIADKELGQVIGNNRLAQENSVVLLINLCNQTHIEREREREGGMPGKGDVMW